VRSLSSAPRERRIDLQSLRTHQKRGKTFVNLERRREKLLRAKEKEGATALFWKKKKARILTKRREVTSAGQAGGRGREGLVVSTENIHLQFIGGKQKLRKSPSKNGAILRRRPPEGSTRSEDRKKRLKRKSKDEVTSLEGQTERGNPS